MLASFRNYLIAVVFNLITLTLTCIALFTCRWSYAKVNNSPWGMGILDIFPQTSSCAQWPTDPPTWFTLAGAFMITSLICQVILVVQALFTLIIKCKSKMCHLDDTFQALSWFLLLVSVIVYGVYSKQAFGNNNPIYVSYQLSWSFILACIAIVTSFASIIGHGMYKHSIKQETHVV